MKTKNMTNKQLTLLEDYAAKEEQLKALEAEIEAMKPKVLATLEKQGVDTLKETYGTFSVVYRKKWTYSDGLSEKEKQYNAVIKQEKADEQESGEASFEETKGLSYRQYIPNEKKD